MTLDQILERAKGGEIVPIHGADECRSLVDAVTKSKKDLCGFHLQYDTPELLWVFYDERLLDDAYRKEFCS